MSEQQSVAKEKKKKKWAYNMTKVVLNPSVANELRGYYDEYAMHCQQSHHIPVKFQLWVIEMTKVGYYAWRDKVGKK